MMADHGLGMGGNEAVITGSGVVKEIGATQTCVCIVHSLRCLEIPTIRHVCSVASWCTWSI